MVRGDAELSVVVVPREKYRRARDVFTALLAAGGPPFRLVWVDEGRAPQEHRRWMQPRVSAPGIVHITLPHRAGANECRMRGFEATSTPFVLFLDNDAFLAPGAIAELMDCMHSTNASFVTPLIVERNGTVHHAGGTTEIVEGAGGRRFVEELPLQGKRAATTRHQLVRAPTSALEMHGFLVRSDCLVTAGGLDTELLSSLDCADLGLRMRRCDDSGWLEPNAILTYDGSSPRVSDLALYLGRWSRATVEHDMARFASTWDIDAHDARLESHRGFLRPRRMRVLRYLRGGARRAFGPSAVTRLEDAFDPFLDLFSDARAGARW